MPPSAKLSLCSPQTCRNWRPSGRKRKLQQRQHNRLFKRPTEIGQIHRARSSKKKLKMAIHQSSGRSAKPLGGRKPALKCHSRCSGISKDVSYQHQRQELELGETSLPMSFPTKSELTRVQNFKFY